MSTVSTNQNVVPEASLRELITQTLEERKRIDAKIIELAQQLGVEQTEISQLKGLLVSAIKVPVAFPQLGQETVISESEIPQINTAQPPALQNTVDYDFVGKIVMKWVFPIVGLMFVIFLTWFFVKFFLAPQKDGRTQIQFPSFVQEARACTLFIRGQERREARRETRQANVSDMSFLSLSPLVAEDMKEQCDVEGCYYVSSVPTRQQIIVQSSVVQTRSVQNRPLSRPFRPFSRLFQRLKR